MIPSEAVRFTPPLFGSCVYFLLDGEEVVYVGQTKSRMLARIDEHRVNKVFDSVAILECDPAHLLRVEIEWIFALTPKYNREHLPRSERRWNSPTYRRLPADGICMPARV
jgi:hypothetical protein